MSNFWEQLPRPFFVMAPMADVTDAAFRSLVCKRGAPHVFWTEFVSADGLYHTREIQQMPDKENPLMRDLSYSSIEHPIVAQIFSRKPEMIAYATRVIAMLGFDGVDINMGCPDRAIERQGCGAAMIKTPELAVEIIRAARLASPLPVSVKTRVGYNEESLETWLPILLEAEPAAITLHLRTRKELSLVPARWELMQKAIEIRNRVNPKVLLIGNGDVTSIETGLVRVREANEGLPSGVSGVEGVMIGRGMFGNPWVFAGRGSEDTPLAVKLAALLELAYDFERISPPKSFAIVKKHIKAFVTGFDGAAHLRALLMEAESADELKRIIAKFPSEG